MSWHKQLSAFFLLVALAGIMRFSCLGTWSFGFDELFTVLETELHYGDKDLPEQYRKEGIETEDTQYARLPRMIPVPYLFLRAGYQLFGTNEFGSRCMTAAFGSLGVGVIFLLSYPLLKAPGSIALSLLVLLWPEHLLQSQNNRFYIISFFFCSVVLLLGGQIARNRSWAATFWIGPAALVMILSNPMSGLLWGFLLGGLLIDAYFSKLPEQAVSSKKTVSILFILLAWSVVFLGVGFFHVLPIAAHWNSGQSNWGYSPGHAVMAFVQGLTWPYVLFGGLGLVSALSNIRTPGNGYWSSLSLACGGAVILMPLAIVYNPNYGFPFMFPTLVLSALSTINLCRFIPQAGKVETNPKAHGFNILAVLWIVTIPLFNLPSLISYYRDGGRPDSRAAFSYVAKHWQKGDRLTGFLMGTADRYIPDRNPKIPLRTDGTASRLQQIIDGEEAGNGRLWIVVTSSRGGLELELLRWLTRNTVLETKFGKKRFDYPENNVDVYLYDPDSGK